MFKNDLQNWKQIERELASKLVRRNILSLEYAPNWQFKDWDLKVRYDDNWKVLERTFEVKDDKISSGTGNVWFEFRCFGKPSGIYSSKADYIVYHLDNKFYFQDRWELLYRLGKVPKEIKTWWDYNWAELYIVNKRYLNDLFKELT